MNVAKTAIRWLYYLLAGALFAHFLFVWPLAQRVALSALLVFALACAFVLPWTRRRLALLPLLRWGWLRALVCLFLVSTANSWLEKGDRPEIARADYAFVGATLIDGRPESDPVPDAVVLVGADGRIDEVGTARSLEVPDGFEVVDLSGKFLVPGLLNAHGHLMLPGRDPDETQSMGRFAVPDLAVNALSWFLDSYPGHRLLMWQMERNTQRALRGGVTTLRGLGDANYVDVAVRKRIESGRRIGPRLLVAGPLICVTGGHAHQIGLEVDGADEARRAVRQSLRREVDVIKIASTGGVSDSRRIGEAGELQMTPEEISAVVDEAHRKNVLVTAHAESAQGVLEALRAGVDNIEHGAELDDEAIALFENNPHSLRGYSTLHPTLSVVSRELAIDDSAIADPVVHVMTVNGNVIRERMISGFKTAIARGVRVAVGTDAGIVDHGSVWKEMQHFVDLGGVSTRRALYMGTLGTARSIGVEDLTGSIEAGKSADLVVLDADPLADLTAFAAPAMVVAAGVIVE